MSKQPPVSFFYWQTQHFWLLFIACCIVSCNNTEQKPPPEVVVVKIPEKIDEKVKELLQTTLRYTMQNEGKLNDSVILKHTGLLDTIYNTGSFQPIWSSDEKWNTLADSLYAFIAASRLYGLFPSDYHVSSLINIRTGMASDSLHKKNAALWARADVLFTDAYLSMAKDLRLGRLAKDSITLRNDSLVNDTFFIKNFEEAVTQKNIRGSLEQLEPKLKGYADLKASIASFLDSAQLKTTTYILYPSKDSSLLLKQVENRLNELDFAITPGDSASFRGSIRKYQKLHGIPVTGKIGDKTVTSLNNSDWLKFKRIAVNLDRYKLMADTMPHQYIWVNLPGFYLQLWNDDTITLQSKIVVGKPLTRTPLLTSKITDMVTYPQWTIPESIILKEVLPGLKKDTNYLTKKGYSLINSRGDEIYASSVNWNKYSKGIPYKVVQGSGDDNALGILKFNFSNKYSVYLHDTNQRYYFSRTFRALSHGCVRVQQWDKLARFIISNDSLNAAVNVNTFKTDTLKAWLSRKEKHVIPVRTKLPVYIRYFGCSGIEGKVKFYDDIYNEDRMLIDRYFANKAVN
ncbi:MAG TPA: L,D-transpeptidase family protein [Chitinophagaceae bacterium]|nr:L,D-transpeptidase family protein [Chitinophagaceae bacterium]